MVFGAFVVKGRASASMEKRLYVASVIVITIACEPCLALRHRNGLSAFMKRPYVVGMGKPGKSRFKGRIGFIAPARFAILTYSQHPPKVILAWASRPSAGAAVPIIPAWLWHVFFASAGNSQLLHQAHNTPARHLASPRGGT